MQSDTDAAAASTVLASKLAAVLAHARRSGATHVDVLPDDVLRVVFPSLSTEQSTMTSSKLAEEEAKLAAEVAAVMATAFGDAASKEGEDARGDESMELDEAPAPNERVTQPANHTTGTAERSWNRRERRQRKPTTRSRAWRAHELTEPMPRESIFTQAHERERAEMCNSTNDGQAGVDESDDLSRERGEAKIRAVQERPSPRDWNEIDEHDDDDIEEEENYRSRSLYEHGLSDYDIASVKAEEIEFVHFMLESDHVTPDMVRDGSWRDEHEALKEAREEFDECCPEYLQELAGRRQFCHDYPVGERVGKRNLEPTATASESDDDDIEEYRTTLEHGQPECATESDFPVGEQVSKRKATEDPEMEADVPPEAPEETEVCAGEQQDSSTEEAPFAFDQITEEHLFDAARDSGADEATARL